MSDEYLLNRRCDFHPSTNRRPLSHQEEQSRSASIQRKRARLSQANTTHNPLQEKRHRHLARIKCSPKQPNRQAQATHEKCRRLERRQTTEGPNPMSDTTLSGVEHHAQNLGGRQAPHSQTSSGTHGHDHQRTLPAKIQRERATIRAFWHSHDPLLAVRHSNLARRQNTNLHTRRPQISITNTIWFMLMFLLLIVSCAMAFGSFIWLVAAAASGVGLMPWLVMFPLSLIGVWVAAGQVEL